MRMRMLMLKAGVVALLMATLFGCATPRPAPDPQPLLQDTLFAPPAEQPDPDAVFNLSPAMRDYAERELRGITRQINPRSALIDALYRSRLRLRYDASSTRNAAQAFAAQSGNCLSLVIMTASFARHLGMPVSFQAVQTDDFYSRSGDLYLASGHVNLVLDAPALRQGFARSDNAPPTSAPARRSSSSARTSSAWALSSSAAPTPRWRSSRQRSAVAA